MASASSCARQRFKASSFSRSHCIHVDFDTAATMRLLDHRYSITDVAKKMHVFAPQIAERSVNHIRSLQSLPFGRAHVLDHACGHVLKRWHQRVCDVCAERVERIIRTPRAERVQRDVPRNARHELLPGCSHQRRWTVSVPSHPRESAEAHSSVTSSSSTCCSNTPTRACCSNSLTLSRVVST